MSSIIPPSFLSTEVDKEEVVKRPLTPYYCFSDGDLVGGSEEERIEKVVFKVKKTFKKAPIFSPDPCKHTKHGGVAQGDVGKVPALRTLGLWSEKTLPQEGVSSLSRQWQSKADSIKDPIELLSFEQELRQNYPNAIVQKALDHHWELLSLEEGLFHLSTKDKLNISWKEHFFSCKFKNLLEKAKGDYEKIPQEWKSLFDNHSYLVKFIIQPYCFSSWKCEDTANLQLILNKFPLILELDLEGWDGVNQELVTQISSLRFLRNLDLSSTDIDDNFLLSVQLRNVVQLRISNTEISSRGLKSIENCIGMELLDISSCCNLDDSVGKVLSNLFLLRHLNMSGCHGVPKEGFRFLNNMALIQELNVSYTKFSEESLINLRYLSRIAKLDLSSTMIEGSGLEYVPKTRLTELKMRRCSMLQGQWYEKLSRFYELKKIDLSFNGVLQANSLEAITQLPLTSLDLSYCYSLGKGVGTHLSKMVNLEELYLSGCTNIPAKSFRGLGKIKSLGVLLLDETNIGYEGIRSIESLRSLHFLSMAYCQNLDEKSMRALSNLKNLFHLVLSGCSSVNKKGLIALSNSNVYRLDLSGCFELPSDGLEALMKFKNLKEVSLFRSPRAKLGAQVLQEMDNVSFKIVV
jgi:hypothetical protein